MRKAKNGECLDWLLENAISFKGSNCLIWPYSICGAGYGQLTIGGKRKNSHRVVCEIVNGPQPALNYEAAHDCGVRNCVNPNHIRWDTRKNNLMDRIKHETANRGEKHGLAKLSTDDVLKIRSLKGLIPQVEIAKIFNISKQHVSRLIKKENWDWLQEGATS